MAWPGDAVAAHIIAGTRPDREATLVHQRTCPDFCSLTPLDFWLHHLQNRNKLNADASPVPTPYLDRVGESDGFSYHRLSADLRIAGPQDREGRG